MKIDRIKGFRDQYPEDMEPRKWLLNVAEERAEKFGFLKIDVPSLESIDLYKIKSGEELVSQTFSFVDRGQREVTMIPEFTPSVVRMLTSRKDIPRPVRWYGTPKLWRYEEPQAGRLREHIQFNADIFGPDTAEADAEVIGLSASILDSLGLSGEYEIRIGDRKISEEFLKRLGVKEPEKAFPIIDKFRKMTREEFLDALAGAGSTMENAEAIAEIVSEKFEIEDLEEVLKRSLRGEELPKLLLDRIRKTGRLVKSYTESEVKYDFSIVRGLSYYTGIVFEVFDIKGEYRSILGGGRYDNLASLLSDQDIPAVGFGMGDAVIELLLRRTGKWNAPDRGRSYYVAILGEESMEYGFGIANQIRKYSTAMLELSGRGLSAQMKSASTSGCTHAVIIGEREFAAGTVTIRDMSSGEQENLRKKTFFERLAI